MSGQDDTVNLSDADLWEHLVRQGKSQSMATAMVLQRRKTQPFAGPARGAGREWNIEPRFTPGQQFGALVGQGATLGFGAKALGAIDATNAMLPKQLGGESLSRHQFGDRYAATRDRILDAEDEGIADHPIAGRVTEFGAGLLTALPSMGAKGAALAVEEAPALVRMGRHLVSGAQTGAKIGAVAGAGHATGGLGDYARSMANDAAAGGVIGAGSGVLLPPIMDAVASGFGKALTTAGIRPSGRTAGEMAADRVRMNAPQGPETPPQATMSGAMGGAPSNAQTDAAPKVSERMRAGIGRAAERLGVESSKTRALRELMRRFDLDNVSTDDAVAFAKANEGKPVAVLDLGHNNVADLARTSKDVPGLGKRIVPEFLHGRSAGARGDEGQTLQRITGDFEKRIGLKPENYFQSIEDMTADMKKNAGVDYGKIRNTVVEDPEVLSIFNEPEFRAVHEAIRTNARLRRGEPIPPLTSDEITFGKKITSQNPQTVGTLDKMKRHLDQIIGGQIEGGPIQRDHAYAMRDRLNAGLERLDELHPEYKSARSTYRGSAEAIQAFEEGRSDLLTKDPRLVQQKLAKIPERLQDYYRRGGYDALRGNLLKMEDGANLGAQLEKTPEIRMRVQALAKNPADAELLRDDLGLERHMGVRKNQILGGPNTAERLIAHSSTVPRVTQAGNVARKLPGVGKFMGDILDNSLTRRTAEQTGDVMGEVGKLMTRSGTEGIQLTADEIRQLKMQEIVRQLKRRRRLSVGGGLAGGQPPGDRP